MNKCVRIRITGIVRDVAMIDSIIQSARALSIEGSVHFVEAEGVRIFACGSRDGIESFVDSIHRMISDPSADIFVEPFLKDRDYRGVFRVIE
jgi:acylphosphatase